MRQSVNEQQWSFLGGLEFHVMEQHGIAKPGRIFYHCYDHQRPNGGQKSTYQHVDALNRNGYSAFAVHTLPDFKLRWFPNATRTITWSEVWNTFDPQSDLFVFPEDLGVRLMDFPGRKILFNKNLYFGYQAFGLPSAPSFKQASHLYRHKIIGAMAVSDHNLRSLQFAFPEVPIIKVVECIDSTRFTFAPLHTKKRQAAFVYKSVPFLLTVLQTFLARAESGYNCGRDFRWVALEGKTEIEVADILRESLILLFPSAEEGLGRLPLEGLMSGCIVLASDVAPMSEYVPTTFRFPYGDVVGMVSRIESLIEANVDLAETQACVLSGRESALAYSSEAQEKSVCAAWDVFWTRALSDSCSPR